MTASLRYTLGRLLADYLSQPLHAYEPFSIHDTSVLEQFLEPADVLLVEGNTRVSTAIKYLTQSTWSHAAIYVGDAAILTDDQGRRLNLVEAELNKGVIASPLAKYRDFNTRICRPVGLSATDRERVVKFMVGSLGLDYDLKHVFDLARYLLPTPPVPVRFRRRMLALGSGDPSRGICSTLIAEAFQSVGYPILPRIEKRTSLSHYRYSEKEILHIRHHSLFAPRDFDLSPYFRIVKPTIEHGFDYRGLTWAVEDDEETENRTSPSPPL